MRQTVKITPKIGFDHPPVSSKLELAGQKPHRVSGPSAWSIPIAEAVELGLPNQLQDPRHSLLQHLVLRDRNSQRSFPRGIGSFGNPFPSNQPGPVTPFLQSRHQILKVLFQMSLVIRDRDVVHPARSVAANGFPTVQQELLIELPRKVLEPVGFVDFSFLCYFQQVG